MRTRRERQEQAIERQKLHDKRTNEEQLTLIKTRPGESNKEKHRLESKMHKKQTHKQR